MGTNEDTPSVSEMTQSRGQVDTTDLQLAAEDGELADALGAVGKQEFNYGATATGESVAFRYDSPEKAVRELVANAETACIDAAEFLLLSEGVDTDDLDPSELLARARDEVGYEPQIEVRHSHPQSNEPALTIWDNGIGISLTRYEAIRNFSHTTGELKPGRLGTFGQGLMSTFTLVGKHGAFTARTKSREDDISYAINIELDGPEPFDADREAYGTTLTLPSFTMDGRDIDIAETVEEYAQHVRVPILYYESGKDGQEVQNEEYDVESLLSRYAVEQPTVYLENECFEAVMSPHATNVNDGVDTVLVSMPIDRNTEAGTSRWRSDSYWPYDLRIKQENGPIVNCECHDVDHKGLVPVEAPTYEAMNDKERERHIPRPELSEGDVSLPEPVDDRDRLEAENDDFWAYLNKTLRAHAFDEYIVPAAEEVGEHGSDAIDELGINETGVLLRHVNTETGREPDRDDYKDIANDLGVDSTETIVAGLLLLHSNIEHAPRNCSRPNRVQGRNSTSLAKVLSMAKDDDVYMGVSISRKKASLAWALGDNTQVVSVDDTTDYDYYEDEFGWKKLKDLPSHNVEEKLDVELDESLLKRVDNSYGDSDSSSGGRGSSELNARTRRIKIQMTNGRSSGKAFQARNVYHTLNQGEALTISLGSIRKLLVLKDTNDPNLDSWTSAFGVGQVGITSVPNYVHEYLIESNNVYDSVQDLVDDIEDAEFATFEYTHDGSYRGGKWERSDDTLTISDTDKSTPILVVDDATRRVLTREVDHPLVNNKTELASSAITALLEHAGLDEDDYDRVALTDGTTVSASWIAFPNNHRHDRVGVDLPQVSTTDAPVLKANHSVSIPNTVDYETAYVKPNDILVDHLFHPDDFDREAPEWDAMAGENLEGLMAEGDEALAVARTLQKLEHQPHGPFSST